MNPDRIGRIRVVRIDIAETAEALEWREYLLSNMQARDQGKQTRERSVLSIQTEKERRIAIYSAMVDRGERLFG